MPVADDVTTLVAQQGLLLLVRAETTLWLLLRIGAAMMVAPLIGTYAVPPTIRLLITALLALTLTPLVPAAPAFVTPDSDLIIAVAHELFIGIGIGLVLRIAFEAGAVAGEIVALGMGLSFAQMADPLRGNQTGIVAQWFYLTLGLLFFAFDGHLLLIELLFQSYKSVPVAAPLPDLEIFLLAVPGFMSVALQVGLHLSLPVMFAMLIVNLAFGLLGRAAPTLNPIAIGLPASLLLGLLILTALTGDLQAPVRQLFDAAFAQVTGMLE